MAYNTWTQNDQQEAFSEAQTPNLPGLNSKESKQLFQFLSNQTCSNQQKLGDQESVAAHMAPVVPSVTTIYNSNAICCLRKLDSGSSILNSGASDHMSFDTEALHNLQLLDRPVLYLFPIGLKSKLLIVES